MIEFRDYMDRIAAAINYIWFRLARFLLAFARFRFLQSPGPGSRGTRLRPRGVHVLAEALFGLARRPLRPTREPGRLPRSALADHGMLRTLGDSGA